MEISPYMHGQEKAIRNYRRTFFANSFLGQEFDTYSAG